MNMVFDDDLQGLAHDLLRPGQVPPSMGLGATLGQGLPQRGFTVAVPKPLPAIEPDPANPFFMALRRVIAPPPAGDTPVTGLDPGAAAGQPVAGVGAPAAAMPQDSAPAAATGDTASTASAYDVDKAIGYLDKHADPQYNKRKDGYCATAVRLAIAAGGRAMPQIHYAKDYGPTLVQAGFTHLDAGALKNYTPVKGDVIVIPAVGTHTSGHMEMYDGKHWVSDFMQNSQFPLRGVKNPTPYDVYRP